MRGEIGRDLASDPPGRCGLLARRPDLPCGGCSDRGAHSGPADIPTLDVTNGACLPVRVRHSVGPDRRIGGGDGVAPARLQLLGDPTNGFGPPPGNEDQPRSIGRGAHRRSRNGRAPHGFSSRDRRLPRGVHVAVPGDAGDLLAGGQDDRRLGPPDHDFLPV